MKITANLPLTTQTIAALISCTSLSLAQNHKSTQMAQMGNSSRPASKQSSLPFSDISRNVYKPEILEAVQLKIVQGFPDGTFRPNQPVTREQPAHRDYTAAAIMRTLNCVKNDQK